MSSIKKKNILCAAVGLLLGMTSGMMFANLINKRGSSQAQTPGVAKRSPEASNSAASNTASQEELKANAQALIRKAKDEPDNYEAQIKAADLYYQVQLYDKAIEHLTRASQLRPPSYEMIATLGALNSKAERYQEAARWYTKALDQRPDDADIRADLGLTFLLREPPDTERAIKEFRRVLARKPDHELALRNMVLALARKGEKQEAQAMLARLAQVNPNNSSIPELRLEVEKSSSPTNPPSTAGER